MSTDYSLLSRQMSSLIEDEKDPLALYANVSALLNQSLENINWVGFYFVQGDELVLGPFQGNVACFRIKMGRGVCGTAAAEVKTMRVGDVHQFAGHIACDAASNSEIVVPLVVNGKIIGVLDIDSPSLNRFDEADEKGLSNMMQDFALHLSQCEL